MNDQLWDFISYGIPTVLVWILIAQGVRWAWHRGAPRARHAVRVWWNAGR